MASKIPLKDMLSALDRNNYNFIENLEDDVAKDFSPWLAMRYASSCRGKFAAHYLIMVNDLVNHNFTAISKHPLLQWKLLAVCGAGSVQFHEFIRPPKRRGKNDIQEFISKIYTTANNDELALLEMQLSEDDIYEMAVSLGYDDSEIKKLME